MTTKRNGYSFRETAAVFILVWDEAPNKCLYGSHDRLSYNIGTGRFSPRKSDMRKWLDLFFMIIFVFPLRVRQRISSLLDTCVTVYGRTLLYCVRRRRRRRVFLLSSRKVEIINQKT